MSRSNAPRHDPPTHGMNIFPFASMAGGWLGPLIMFWLYVWGPLRPFHYQPGDFLPPVSFALVLVACVSLWWIPPHTYFRVHGFERSGRCYEYLGVVFFRWFTPDGDFANRWERQKDPNFRVIRGRQSAANFVVRTEQSERGHLVLLAFGIASATWAWSIGWYGWAIYLSAGNVIVNVYPILLQRYTRSRLHAVLNRGSQTDKGAP